jgi:DNA-binding NarL/FixJ family response regulator
MVDPGLRKRIARLLETLRSRPSEIPAGSIVELAGTDVDVAIDRTGDETTVFVSPRPDRRFQRLSKREKEVATLVAAGFSNRQIADALFISESTVKDHVHSILTKTELASRSEVAAAWHGGL